MTKIGIIGYKGDWQSIVPFLQREGVVEIVPLRDAEERPAELENLLRRVDAAAAFICESLPQKPQKPILAPKEAAKIIESFPAEEVLRRVEELRQRRDEANAKLNRAQNLILMLKPWTPCTTPLGMIKDTTHCCIRMGTIPSHLVETFEKEAEEQELFFWREISRGHEGMHLIVVFHKAISDWALGLLAKVEFTHWEPKQFRRTVAEELLILESEVAEARAELEEVAKQAQKLKKHLLGLWLYADHIEQLIEQHEVVAAASHTQKTFALQGWIPKKLLPHLRRRLEVAFDTVEVVELPTLPEDEPPVALKNPFFVEAFEIITDLYGRPRKGMVDPTPFMAPFFAIYFALCLTDAGYGLLLTLIATAGLLWAKVPSVRKFFRMILYVGVLTIGAGIITGGYFGIKLPPPSEATGLAKLALSLKLFDPLRDIMVFFALSIALGIVQLSVGFILAGYVQLREAKGAAQYLHAIVVTLAWVAATVGVGMFVIYKTLPNELPTFKDMGVRILEYGALGIAGGHLILGPLAGKSIGTSIGNAFGFDGLYGIIGVFSDLLSFVRLTALGLSTGIVAGVITGMTLQMKGALLLAGIVILVGGHIFYCLFSSLGAFVHPTRLQFVEFFSKFYESGGKPFEPFRRRYKRVEVI